MIPYSCRLCGCLAGTPPPPPAPPQIVAALDLATHSYTTSFVRRLVERRLTEFSLWDPNRFKLFELRRHPYNRALECS